MESKNTGIQPASGNLTRHRLRVLRPFGWWLLLVLVLFGIRTHQRLMEQTRLTFSLALEGRGLAWLLTDGPTAAFDGRGIESGQMIPLGWHTFTASHPQGESFTTNMFVWYGPHSFGKINLKRTRGLLEVRLNPPADWLTIRGPEYINQFTNSSGFTSSVPTDAYVVEARYPHWRQSRELNVSTNSAAVFSINTKFSALEVNCNQTGATFQIFNSAGEPLDAGEIPGKIQDLPEGEYELTSRHQGNEQARQISIKPGTTNSADVKFVYGSMRIETDPPGARVSGDDGREWGYTPLQMGYLPAGHRKFNLERNGYEPLTVAAEILPDQTVSISTNLVGRNYSAAIEGAKRHFQNREYEQARISAAEALLAKKDDTDALEIQQQSVGYGHMQKAEALGARGDYIAGIREIQSALDALPANGQFLELLSRFKEREPEQRDGLRKAAEARVRSALDAFARPYGEARLYQRREVKTKAPTSAAAKSIEDALWSQQPRFVVVRREDANSDILAFETNESDSDGFRRCIVAIGPCGKNETLVAYKVLEYRNERNFIVDTRFRVTMPIEHFALKPAEMTEKQKARMEEGERIAADCVQRAVQ